MSTYEFTDEFGDTLELSHQYEFSDTMYTQVLIGEDYVTLEPNDLIALRDYINTVILRAKELGCK